MNNLKKLRIQNNLTLKELSKKVNIVTSTISCLENGKRQFTQEHLEILSKFFECSTDYLLGKTDNRNTIKVVAVDSDGTMTEAQHQLLDATKGMTAEDLIEVNKYIDYLKYQSLIFKRTANILRSLEIIYYVK